MRAPCNSRRDCMAVDNMLINLAAPPDFHKSAGMWPICKSLPMKIVRAFAVLFGIS